MPFTCKPPITPSAGRNRLFVLFRTYSVRTSCSCGVRSCSARILFRSDLRFAVNSRTMRITAVEARASWAMATRHTNPIQGRNCSTNPAMPKCVNSWPGKNRTPTVVRASTKTWRGLSFNHLITSLKANWGPPVHKFVQLSAIRPRQTIPNPGISWHAKRPNALICCL